MLVIAGANLVFCHACIGIARDKVTPKSARKCVFENSGEPPRLRHAPYKFWPKSPLPVGPVPSPGEFSNTL